MEKAKGLLLSHPDIPFKIISEKIGYNSASYFSCIFREYENISPSEFRKIHGIV
ncbi:MAG: helix-turn-helix domain-containing protein [Clostridiales bacterium]|nr:helix-turn-helix domain-containing protein [Clostridiales bacterium]